MNVNKPFIIINAIIILSIMAAVFINMGSQIDSSPASKLEECQAVKFNGEGKTGIVFFSDLETAKKYVDFLETIKPFDELGDRFNYYYIDDYTPSCKIYKGVALLCYSSEIIQKASSCPTDYIVALEDQPSSIRSSSYLNVMSLNVNHPFTVFAHEFGHAFLNLAEEYVPANLPRSPKNCKETCEVFEGEKDGCYTGCSDADYIRSINNGIMRTLSSNDFGIFNVELFRDKIETPRSILTGRAIEGNRNCEDEKYYWIEAYYDSVDFGSVIVDKKIVTGCYGSNGEGESNYKVLDGSGTSLLEESFNPEMIYTDAPEDDEINGETFANSGLYVLRIPILESAETMKIEDGIGTNEVDLTDIVEEEIILDSNIDLGVEDIVQGKKEDFVGASESTREEIIKQKKIEIEAELRQRSEAIAAARSEEYARNGGSGGSSTIGSESQNQFETNEGSVGLEKYNGGAGLVVLARENEEVYRATLIILLGAIVCIVYLIAKQKKWLKFS